jgi:ketosteroid isomerase-like protein
MAKRATKRSPKRGARRAARPAKARARARVAAPRPSPAAAVVKLDGEFMKAAAARDAAALVAAFYAPEAVLMPPNHPPVEGREGIRAFLQGLMDAGVTSIKLSTQKVWSAGALAVGRGSYTLAMSPPDGVSIEDHGKYVVCYRRQPNGAWRAIADIFNSDQAAAAP